MTQACDPHILDAYRHDELSASDRRHCESHLLRCPDCTRALDEMRALGHLCQAARQTAPADLGARILAVAQTPPRPGVWTRLAATLLGAVLAGLSCWGASRLTDGSAPAPHGLGLRADDVQAVRDAGLRRHAQALTHRPEHLILAALGRQEGR